MNATELSGTVTSIKGDILGVGITQVSLRDVKNKPPVKIGDTVEVHFTLGRYYAAWYRVIKPKEKKMKSAKTVEEYITSIAEMQPFLGQEFTDRLSDDDKIVLQNVMRESVGNSIRLYNITATYDDTRKDLVEIAEKVLELAFTLTVVIDTNTTQILKKNLPPEETEKEKEAKK